MIFTTMEERDEVMDRIMNCERLEGLSGNDSFVIECMYDCMRAIENTAEEYEGDTKAAEVLEEAYEGAACMVAEVYVSMLDSVEESNG